MVPVEFDLASGARAVCQADAAARMTSLHLNWLVELPSVNWPFQCGQKGVSRVRAVACVAPQDATANLAQTQLQNALAHQII
jgi:hypothetical protein